MNGAATFPFDVQRQGPGRLAESMREERITICRSVPPIFRSFLAGDARFPDVRCIRLEGDRSSRVDVDLFRRHFESSCVLVNGLGATETGLVRQFFVDHETEVDDGFLPVGHPVPGVDVVVLDETVPEFMIPSLYVTLAALPVDANGKLDRLALPPPVRAARPSRTGARPRDPLEERIARVFEGVLDLERVDVDESFFDLGGDSLAAAEICARRGAETGLELPPSTLLEAPTVKELARLVGSSDEPPVVSRLWSRFRRRDLARRSFS